jgi:hypothetical protein
MSKPGRICGGQWRVGCVIFANERIGLRGIVIVAMLRLRGLVGVERGALSGRGMESSVIPQRTMRHPLLCRHDKKYDRSHRSAKVTKEIARMDVNTDVASFDVGMVGVKAGTFGLLARLVVRQASAYRCYSLPIAGMISVT